jgi:hypothetical protein
MSGSSSSATGAAPPPPATASVPLTWNLSNSAAAEAQHLLPGERVVHIDAHVFYAYDATNDATRVAGALICTNFQLLFVESAEPHVNQNNREMMLPVFTCFYFSSHLIAPCVVCFSFF